MGYVVPRCVEDGTWMLWGNSSVAAVAVVALARSFLNKFLKKSSFLVIFMKNDFWGHLFLRMSFFNFEFSLKARLPAV